jgi:hypothetical protein
MKYLPIGFVIVNFNSGELLASCIKSINYYSFFNPRDIIVVDNGSADNSLSIAESMGVKIIKAGNIGYGASCNLGIKYVQSDYVFFLNADTEIISVNKGALEKVLKENVALIAPALQETGTVIFNFNPFFGPLFDALLRDTGFEKRLNNKHPLVTTQYFSGWSSGAALLINKEFYKRIGGFDENFFLYYEEVDLCYRIFKAGGLQVYLPSLVILHVGGGSSRDLNWSRTAIRYDSKRYYWQKHSGGIILLTHRIFTVLVLLMKVLRAIIVKKERHKLRAYKYALQIYLYPTYKFHKLRAKTWWWKCATDGRIKLRG